MFERRRINNCLTRNIDFLRQARQWNAMKTGTLKKRARNKIEIMFDNVAANDASTVEVEHVTDQVFLTLNSDEVTKAAQSFATNTHVQSVKMSGLRQNDSVAVEMAKSLTSKTSVRRLNLENKR